MGQTAETISVATMPPVVVKSVPQAGNMRVDPSLSEIRVTFSKDMADGSWSWSQISDETYPKTTGKPRYLDDRRTCVLPVELEPGKGYVISINSAKYGNFKDAKGRSAVPYPLAFATKGAETSSAAARTWKDSTGKFAVEAELIDVEDNMVKLKKTSGIEISIPLDKLCQGRPRVRRRIRGPGRLKASRRTSRGANSRANRRNWPSTTASPRARRAFPGATPSGSNRPRVSGISCRCVSTARATAIPRRRRRIFTSGSATRTSSRLPTSRSPYSRFQRGPQKWVTLKVKPTKVPKEFVIALGFNAEKTKGVYISHDAEGTSLVGLAGQHAGSFTGGNWLIRASVDQLKTVANDE